VKHQRSAHRAIATAAGLVASAALVAPFGIGALTAASAAAPHTVQLKSGTVQLKSSTVQLGQHDTVQLKSGTVQLKSSTVQLGQHDTVQLKSRTVQLTVQL
jgi:hypothetical protein